MWFSIWFWRYHTYVLGGWVLYLVFGMPLHYRSHLLPNSSLFRNKKERRQARLSIMLWWLFAGFLYLSYTIFGRKVFTYYLGPYAVFAAWIALVTHLHHTHPDVPWYRDGAWSYLRGAFSTIDRDYGLVEELHHNIGTHIIHHLFTKIPHYHLKESTERIKPVLGIYYKKSEDSVIGAALRSWKTCRFVPDEGDVVFYRT